jgi:hypothetical protein
MWKILLAFVVFAALAMWVLTKSGGNVDLGGEKHDVAPAASAASH